MAIREILRWPDERLSTPCGPAGRVEADLVRDMFETMYAAPGRGLAAPQVGVMRRLFVMDAGWKEGTPTPRVVADPRIVWSSPERAVGEEGCLSIPGIAVAVERPVSVRLRWLDEAGVGHEETLDGTEARCAQHEIDHLDGRVTLDRVDAARRAELVAFYDGAA